MKKKLIRLAKLTIISLITNVIYSGVHVLLNEFDVSYTQRVVYMFIFDVSFLHGFLKATRWFLGEEK